jgi:predicted RNA-binding protein with PUA-like domain
MSEQSHWLVKESPGTFSIDDLEEAGTTAWFGVRNYEARNNMQEMEEGDRVLYYHSGANPPKVVGLARVVEEAYPDETQFDEDSPYHDEDATREDPTWYNVEIEHVETFERSVPLGEIKDREELEDMTLVNRSRLSVQPVEPDEFEVVREMARED